MQHSQPNVSLVWPHFRPLCLKEEEDVSEGKQSKTKLSNNDNLFFGTREKMDDGLRLFWGEGD